MKALSLLLILASAQSWGKVESFLVRFDDRRVVVKSAEQKRPLFSVTVENRSLSDLIGKFMVKGENLRFVSIKSGQAETVDIENKTAANVVFVPLSPAFQEVELIFGKREYEIPAKD
jgi:hypothetical protein